MNTNSFKFSIIHKSKKSNARVGIISTPHGEINTPNFITVGTNGAVKALDSQDIIQANLPIIFCNTYHLMLQPGTDVIEQAGGLHKFANISKPIITDSGGFQVFSLKYGGVTEELKSKGSKTSNNSVKKIDENGVLFQSYRDGSLVFLSPETSIQAQKKIGADIIVAFDELLPYHIEKAYQSKALDRTHRWEERSLIEHKKKPTQQALYSVLHGGIDLAMRQQSIDFLSKLDFDGYAIGGSVGKNLEEMITMLSYVVPRLPHTKPNHLLGIADIKSLDACISLGIDTFDSSYPTKAARHGLLLSSKGNIRIMKAGNNLITTSPDAKCSCYTCQNYSLAYLNHLFKSHELSFYRLASIHNLSFMVKKMEEYQSKILNNLI